MWVRIFLLIVGIVFIFIAYCSPGERAKQFGMVVFAILTLLMGIFPFQSLEGSTENKTSEIEQELTTEDTYTMMELNEELTENQTEEEQVEDDSVEEVVIINSDSFSGQISEEEQIDKYEYVAPETGVYHFAFDVSDVNSSFDFLITNLKNEVLTRTYFGGEEPTIELIQGETYKISVEQKYGLLDMYTIDIGIPEPVKNVDGDNFESEITFEGQRDEYYYLAPSTGKYYFEYIISDVNCSLNFQIYDSKNELLKQSNSDTSQGVTVDLVKDERYKININQRYGFVDYKVLIGIPHEVANILDFPLTGELAYEDQCDTYTYVAPYTGEYTLHFNSTDVTKSYHIIVVAPNMEALLSCGSQIESSTIDLTEGVMYTIKIEQKEGYPIGYDIEKE